MRTPMKGRAEGFWAWRQKAPSPDDETVRIACNLLSTPPKPHEE